MAVTLTDPYANANQEVSLSATATNATQVTLHPNCRVAVITFKQSDGTDDSGKVAEIGTDGGAIDDGHTPVGSGGAYAFRVAAGRSRVRDGKVLYMTASTASAVAQIRQEVG